MADDEAVQKAARALPVSERLSHTLWKVRCDAYADVVKECGSAQAAGSALVKEFGAHGGRVGRVRLL